MSLLLLLHHYYYYSYYWPVAPPPRLWWWWWKKEDSTRFHRSNYDYCSESCCCCLLLLLPSSHLPKGKLLNFLSGTQKDAMPIALYRRCCPLPLPHHLPAWLQKGMHVEAQEKRRRTTAAKTKKTTEEGVMEWRKGRDRKKNGRHRFLPIFLSSHS